MLGRRNLLKAVGGFAASSLAMPVFAMMRSYPFDLRNGRLFVSVTVNGVVANALLDSGGEATLIDSASAPHFKLTAGKSLEISGSGASKQRAQFVSGVKLGALGVDLAPEVVVVTDLADVVRRLAGSRLDVVLGREVFDAARLQIDFKHRRIVVLSPDDRPQGLRLPLTTEHGIETLPISIEGLPANATLDLGNGTRPMVSAAFAQKAGWLKDRATSTARGGGIGGEKALTTLVLKRVEIAGHQFNDVEFVVENGPNASDANIGTSLLQHFDVVTDYSEKAVWLQFLA